MQFQIKTLLNFPKKISVFATNVRPRLDIIINYLLEYILEPSDKKQVKTISKLSQNFNTSVQMEKMDLMHLEINIISN